MCKKCTESGLAYYLNNSLHAPKFYRRSLYQTIKHLQIKSTCHPQSQRTLQILSEKIHAKSLKTLSRTVPSDCLGIFINPFYFAHKGLWQGIAKLSKLRREILTWHGQKPYKSISLQRYIGLEIDLENRAYKRRMFLRWEENPA